MTTAGLEVTVEGRGLHTGAPARVRLWARPGPVTLQAGGVTARVDELTVASSLRATTVQAAGGALCVGTVEHVFAALAGLGVYAGLAIDVDGPEMPLLDGGARTWCDAIGRLRLADGEPRLRVVEEVEIAVGPSRYELAPAEGIDVAVCVELDDPRLARHARWTGGANDFRERIAPARTFARARDVSELVERGLARHVDPASVVVLTPHSILHSGRAFTADEPARHKLLDLVGDLYLHGGPPRGRLRAVRPGHASNLRAIREALERGALAMAREGTSGWSRRT